MIWKLPFRVNITAATKPGSNKLVVKVTNLWPNCIIGDEQLPADCEWNGDKLRAWRQWLPEGTQIAGHGCTLPSYCCVNG